MVFCSCDFVGEWILKSKHFIVQNGKWKYTSGSKIDKQKGKREHLGLSHKAV